MAAGASNTGAALPVGINLRHQRLWRAARANSQHHLKLPPLTVQHTHHRTSILSPFCGSLSSLASVARPALAASTALPTLSSLGWCSPGSKAARCDGGRSQLYDARDCRKDCRLSHPNHTTPGRAQDLNQTAILPPAALALLKHSSFPQHGACGKVKGMVHALVPTGTGRPADAFDVSCTNGWTCGNWAASLLQELCR